MKCLALVQKVGGYLRGGGPASHFPDIETGLQVVRSQASFQAVYLRALAFQAAQPFLLRPPPPGSHELADLLALFFETLEGTQAAESAGSRFSLQARSTPFVSPLPLAVFCSWLLDGAVPCRRVSGDVGAPSKS